MDEDSESTAWSTMLVVGLGEHGPSRRWESDELVRIVRVATLDQARSARSDGRVRVAVVDAATLGPDPADALRELRATNDDLVVIVVTPDAASEPALLADGAHEVAVLRRGDPDAAARLVASVRQWAERLAVQELRAARSSLLHGTAAEGYAVLDEHGRFLHGGSGLPGGRPIDAVVGTVAFDWVAPRDRARVRDLFAGIAARTGAGAELETEVVGLGGARRFLEMTLSNLTHEPAIGGIVATYWDITARRLAEEALSFHSALLDAVGQAVIAVEPTGRIVYWNPAATGLYGWTGEEAVGRLAAEVLDTTGWSGSGGVTARVRSGEPWSGELRVRRRDGTTIPVWETDTPVFSDDGSLIAVIGVSTDVTARKAAQATSRHLAAIVESSTEAIMSTDVEDRIRTWNGAAERLFGYPAEEAIGQHVSIVVPPELRAEMEEIGVKVAAGDSVVALETLRRHKTGTHVPVALSVAPLLGDDGEVMGTSSTTRDLTDLVLADRELQAAEVRFQAAFRRSSFGMAIADLEGRPTTVNQAICRMLDRRPSELIGRRWTDFTHPAHIPLGEAVSAHLGRDGDSFSEERQYLRPDGTAVWVQANVTLVRGTDEQPLYFMLQMQDITARKDFQAQLEHRALHDDLTGLPNRALLDDRLDHALAGAARAEHQVGVAFVDVDAFKHVNDALGHATGDLLLVEVGHRLAASVRPGDTVARFGGDEFVVICEEITLPALWSLAGRMTEVLAQRFPVSGTDVALHASIGITISRDGSTSQSLLSEADAAMYQAKEGGAGRIALFDDSLRARAASILEGERVLSAAIASGEIVAYYQPVIDLRDGRTVGFEALARWERPGRGIVLPADFIPLAESTGLIVELGRAVLARATSCAAKRRAADPHEAPMWVSVNLSARQLTDAHLPETVAAILEGNGLDPGLLHLEITETVLMQNLSDAAAVLGRLRDLGVKLSIDDFGTGYSSLAYLKELPVDSLKIDRSFVADLAVGDHSIIKAVLGLSEALGMECIAEGVETESQRLALTELGCRFGQGYLWQRPMPASVAETWGRTTTGNGAATAPEIGESGRPTAQPADPRTDGGGDGSAGRPVLDGSR